MTTTTVDIEFRAKLNQLKAELDSTPKLTKKAAKQITAEWQAQWKAAEKAGVDATKQMAKEGQKLGKVAELVGGKWGDALRGVKGLGELAADGMASTTIAVGVAVGAFAALGLGVATYASIVSGTITNIDSMSESLTEQQREALGPQLLAVQKAHEAQTGLSQAWTEAQINLTASVAPAYQGLTDKLTGLLNRYNDVQEALARNTDDGHKLNVQVAAGAVAYASLSEAQQELMSDEALGRADGWGFFWRTLLQDTSVQVTDFQLEVAAFKKAQREMADAGSVSPGNGPRMPSSGTVDLTFDFAADALSQADTKRTAVAVSNAADREDASTRELMARLELETFVDQAAQDGLEAEKVRASAHAAALQAELRAELDFDRQWQRIQEDRAAWSDAQTRDEMQRIAEVTTARVNAAQDYAQATNRLVGAIGAMVDQGLQHQIDSTREGTKAHAAALRKQFAAAKATAIAQAAINTALGFTQDLARGGVVGIITGALTLAAGGVEIGMIAKQQPPPYHIGGGVGRTGPDAPDEFGARLRSGEGVLSPTGMDTLARMNNGTMFGGGGGGSVIAVPVYGHRVFDAVSSNAINRRTSPMNRALRSVRSTRAGHRQ